MSSNVNNKKSMANLKLTMIWYSMLVGVGVMYFALSQIQLPTSKLELGVSPETFSVVGILILISSLFLGRLGSKNKKSESLIVVSWALAESISVLAYVVCLLGVMNLDEAQYFFLFSYLSLGINNPFLIKAKKKLNLDL